MGCLFSKLKTHSIKNFNKNILCFGNPFINSQKVWNSFVKIVSSSDIETGQINLGVLSVGQ